jgi:hypothetical protein
MTVAGFGSDRGAAVGPLRTAVPAHRAIPTTTIAPVHSDTLSATLGRCVRRGAGELGRVAVCGGDGGGGAVAPDAGVDAARCRARIAR